VAAAVVVAVAAAAAVAGKPGPRKLPQPGFPQPASP
jgi:hypothetical protein